ncbi:SGNH/GDSL hydrolase family protein [Jannaschia sp. R86511]|uniref:SGNH/GDSL hydrolase family protein n=1 Tax=Jannaschia sp. R86511 TaxID=3093853 RepID=UPI0036D36974
MGLQVLGVAALVVWAVKLVQVTRSVSRAAQFWSVPQGEPGDLLYVALGDSTAQGVGASRPDRGYVGLIAQRLRAQTGRAVQVVNLSTSGARIDDVVTQQVPRMTGLEPDLITVGIGGNDLLDYDPVEYVQQVAALTGALPLGAVVADAPYMMHGHWERDAEEAAAQMTRLGHAHGLVVAPLHDALRREGWSAMTNQFAADLFHPNDRGHRVWADAFWKSIREASASNPEQGGTRMTQEAATVEAPLDPTGLGVWEYEGGHLVEDTGGAVRAPSTDTSSRPAS